MSIYKPKHSKNYHVRFMYKGQWFRKSAETSDRKVALAKEKEYRARFIDERKGLRKDITIGKAVDGFVKSKEGTANHENVERDGVVVKQFLCASTDLQDLSTADITRFVAHLKKKKYANSTIKHRLQTFRSSIAFAKSHGFIIPEVDYPKLKLTKGRTRILSQEELQAIENELNPDKDFGFKIAAESKRFRQDAHDIFVLLCATGARFCEVSGLEWQQVNLKAETIHLYRPKVDNESVLMLTDKALNVLQRRAHNPISRQYIFPDKKGGPRGYTGGAIRKAIKRAGLGPEVTPHVIRHTVATRLLEAGLNIMDVQNILGHAEMSTTRRYLHTSAQDAARKAREALNNLNRQGAEPKLQIVGRKE